jgi:hypothetical protein
LAEKGFRKHRPASANLKVAEAGRDTHGNWTIPTLRDHASLNHPIANHRDRIRIHCSIGAGHPVISIFHSALWVYQMYLNWKIATVWAISTRGIHRRFQSRSAVFQILKYLNRLLIQWKRAKFLQFDFFFDIVASLINFNMRYIPLVAWFFSLAAFILALLTFLAGIDGDAMENAAILTVNISSGIFRMIQQR